LKQEHFPLLPNDAEKLRLAPPPVRARMKTFRTYAELSEEERAEAIKKRVTFVGILPFSDCSFFFLF
jgi:hypothetical protein